MAFYRKYRPKTFSEIIGEDHVSKTLLEAVKSKKLSHAYLLCGPRGTGKTSTARLLAKTFNCQTILNSEENLGEPCNECNSCLEISKGRAVDVIEIDAASHTKVDEIREVIDNARFAPANLSKKVYIIDEVHMLSNSSFNALLKTLEEPPAHVVFILATTEVHKLPATILSRTQRYDFHRVSQKSIIKNLKKIAKEENIEIDQESLELIAVSAEGGHRDAIGMLEQIAAVTNKITMSDIFSILGITESSEMIKFVGAIFNNEPGEGLKIAQQLYRSGIEMMQFNKQIIEYLRKILLFKMSGQFLFEDTKENLESIEKLSHKVEQARLINILEIFIKSGQLFKEVTNSLLPVEMAVIESCQKKELKKQDAENSKQNIPSHHARPEQANSENRKRKKSRCLDKSRIQDPNPNLSCQAKVEASRNQQQNRFQLSK